MKAYQRHIYYSFKPAIPWRMRVAFRRWFARRKRRAHSDVWPIKPGSERPPEGWAGWPDGQQFAFVLTHDVDSQKGLDRVKQLAELEMSLGFRSSFNLIPEGPYRVPDELRQWLTARGFEVGVHDHRHDGKLYQSWRRFQSSSERVNHFLREWNAVGFRSGFMLRNLNWIGELEILYDASTFDTDPFEPQPDGVRTIFPFWVPGRTPREGFVEMPYTLPQDSTLFILFDEDSNAIWKKKLDWVASHGGMALMNVHPDYISFGTEPKRRRGEFNGALYRDLLKYVKERYTGRYWHALPREVAAYAREHCKTIPIAAPVQPSH